MMMNWVFGAYSNVYSTAMMQNKDEVKSAGRIARLFDRA
jgi:hypothetical protein